MAGAGYRTWSATEVVTAANVQTYLQDQVCLVFADTTARDAITASEGMICYLKSIDQVQTYNGSAWASVTSVLTGDVLTEDSTNDRVGINESSPGAALHVEVKSGTTDQLVRLYARTGAEHDADLTFALDNGTGETYTIGIDDSDSDAFKISDGTALGTNDRMVIASSGAMTVAGGITTNITGNASGSSGSCTGNAATATALATGRTIGGTSFDGTANIVPGTITVADTTDTSCSVALFESATGDLAPKSDGGLTYNAGTGALTATAFAGPLTGNVTGNASGSSGSCTGNAATATEGTNVTVSANNSTDETVYLTFVDGATGTQGIETDTGLTYNPSSGLLTAAAFAGPISGAVTGNADSATVGTNVTVSANNSTDETVYPTFVDGATGTQGIETDTGLTYNPSSGLLTSTAFAGNITGNVTGNTSGSSGSCTGNAATATEGTNVTVSANNSTDETVYPTFVDGATGTQGIETDTGLTYNPSSGILTSTNFTGALTGNAATATVAAGLTGGFTEGSLILANQVFS